MSSPVCMMTDGSTVGCLFVGAQRSPPRFYASCTVGFSTVSLPFLFSVAGLRGGLQVEGADQIQRRFAQAHPAYRGPQVDHVALLAAACLEAREHVLLQVHAEGPA